MTDPKDQQCNFRSSAAARLAYQAAADRAGLSVGEWMRVVLDHATGLRELASQLDRASQADLSTGRVRKRKKSAP